LGLIIFVDWQTSAERGKWRTADRLLATSRANSMLYGVGVAAVAVIWFLIQYQSVVIQNFADWSFGIAMLLRYMLYEAVQAAEGTARQRIFAIICLLIALQPIFWGLFEQAGGSLCPSYTDRFVDRGRGADQSLFQSINPIFIVHVRAYCLTWLWVWLGKSRT
jgi:POT family proton-dependent oligopeptide transporter